MTNLAEPWSEGSKARLHFAPGFIFEPFGWVTGWLKAVVEAEPRLLASICSLTHQRMHLIALALAHLDTNQKDLTHLLLFGRARDILDRALGRRPKGLKHVFSKLFGGVLSPDGYRRLVDLLEDPVAFKFLAHSAYIDDEELRTLASIPAALRPAIIPSPNSTPKGRIADGLRFLVMRGAAPSFDALVNQLKSCRQPKQFSTQVGKLVDALPLPTEMPAAKIGRARRLDSADAIRELAEKWQNCLEKAYLESVNEGSCAIYLWEGAISAACAIERRGRLGWFLSKIRGPRNSMIEPEALSRIEQAFAEAGVFHDAIARSLIGLIDMDGGETATRRRRRR